MKNDFRHPSRVLSIIAIAVVLLFALWRTGIHFPFFGQSATPKLQAAVDMAVTNPVEFVKSRVTGGVGVAITVNSNGLPTVNSIFHGSPAENAGLHPGDCIVAVNGRSTTGQTLAQVVKAIRGMTGGAVSVTIRRPGSTNLTVIIHRSSWNKIRGTNAFPTP